MLLACDVGGTWIKTAFCPEGDGMPKLLDLRRYCTPRESDLLTVLINLLRDRLDDRPVRRISIAIAANVDAAGVVRYSTNLALQVPCLLADRLTAELDVPVTVENDANAAALAVARLPQAAGLDPLVVVTLGTGIGGGIIVNDRLLRGPCGTAGEIGHLVLDPGGPECRCGRRGCLEAYCGESAIVARYNARAGLPVSDTEELYRRLQEQDPEALATVRETGELLGRGLALVSDIMAPRGFFLVGGVAGFGTRLVGAVQDTLAQTCFLRHMDAVPVVQVIHNDPWIGLKGAVERVR